MGPNDERFFVAVLPLSPVPDTFCATQREGKTQSFPLSSGEGEEAISPSPLAGEGGGEGDIFRAITTNR